MLVAPTVLNVPQNRWTTLSLVHRMASLPIEALQYLVPFEVRKSPA